MFDVRGGNRRESAGIRFEGAVQRKARKLRQRNRRVLTGAIEQLETRSMLSVGGGFLNAGIQGQYFANTTFTGQPVFTRNDDRIDFSLASGQSIAGSISTGYATFPTTNYSVQWNGKVSPRFSETYTFSATSDDSFKLQVRPTGSSTWTTVIDGTGGGATAVTRTGSMALTAGASYDVQVQYVQATGSATAKLYWSSASTPLEVVEAATTSGINADTFWTTMYTDVVKTGRQEWGNPTNYFGLPLVAADSNGWPLADATKIVLEGQNNANGTYLLQFTGRAQVNVSFNWVNFVVNGVSYGSTLPKGVGYNSATNTTTATATYNGSICYLNFTQTQRLPTDANGTGITNVRFYKPVVPNGTNSFASGVFFDPALKSAFSNNFTTLRWLTANFNPEVNWSDRIAPGYAQARFDNKTIPWEHLVMMSNETGKDFYATIPMGATDDYVTKLANLIKYGSDGVNPYTSLQTNPVWPGLNPNLRVYFEWSNEIWNFGFSQAGQGASLAQQAIQSNTATGQILNYDGQSPNGDVYRFAAVRTIQASNIFRSVWGDAAMGQQIRPLLEYQYDNYNATADRAFNFLDDYFNNGDGIQHVANPRPLSYYLWGGGAAVYYGAGNSLGVEQSFQLNNGSFEATNVPAGTAVAGGSNGAWTFSGSAGVYNNGTTSLVQSATLGSITNAPSSRSYGFRFTVGSSDVAVSEIGYLGTSYLGNRNVRILNTNGTEVTSQWFGSNTTGQYAYTKIDQFPFGVGNNTFVKLAANTTYYAVLELNAGDTIYPEGTAVTTAPGITINNAATAVNVNGTWTFTNGLTGSVGYTPIDFKFSRVITGLSTLSQEVPDGAQAGYVQAGGSMTQTVTFPKTGIFALQFMLAYPSSLGSNPIRVLVDGVSYTPNGDGDYTTTNGGRVWGSFGTNSPNTYRTFGSAPFSISATGSHTIQIVGTGTGTQAVLIDNIQITSLDALYSGGIPGNGEAFGQVASQGYFNQLQSQAKYTERWGLKVVAYEGGWSLGGDNGGSPLQNYAKYVDTRTAGVNVTSQTYFSQSGGSLYTFGSYDQWKVNDPYNANSYPLLQGIQQFNAALPPEATNGITIPAVLTPSQVFYSRNENRSNNQIVGISGRGWLSWNVIVPKDGSYTFLVDTSGSGGTATLSIDDAVIPGATNLSTGSVQTISAFLSKGLHSILLDSVSSAGLSLNRVVVNYTGAPTVSPTITSVKSFNGSVQLAWTASPSATGYRLLYGTSSGNYTSTIDVGNALTTNVAGLTNGQQYYFTVIAYNSIGSSLTGNEATGLPVDASTPVTLAYYEFAGQQGNGTLAPVVNNGLLTVNNLSRASGLTPYTNNAAWINGSAASTPIDNVWSSTLSGAQQGGDYYTFRVTVAAGSTLTLSQLTVNAFFQNDGPPRNLSIGVTTRVNNGAESSAVLYSGITNNSPASYVFNLGTRVQNISGFVDIRIYQFGGSPYEYAGIGGNGNDITVTGSVITPLPAVPSNPVATSVSGGVQIAFTDNSTNENGFTIERSTSSDFTQNLWNFNVGSVTGTGSVVTYTDTLVTPATTYYYRVRSFSSLAGSSSASASATITTPVPPATPAAPVVTTPSFARATVSWSGIDASATSVVIRRSTDGVNYTTLATVPVSPATYNDNTVAAGTSYLYQLIATGPTGTSSPSPATQVTTPAGSPASLSATPVTYKSLQLSWTTTDPLATGTKVYRSTDNVTFTLLTTLNLPTQTYTDTGLLPATGYFYRFVATTGTTDSVPANLSVVTPAGPSPFTSDTFAYAAGALSGKTGGTGWNGAWVSSSTSAVTVNTTAMSYPSFDAGSNSVTTTAANASAGRRINTSFIPGARLDQSGNLIGGSGSFYISALLTLNRSAATPWIGLNNKTSAASTLTPGIQFGKLSALNQFAAKVGSKTVYIPGAPVVGQANLLVIKLDLTAKVASFYLNPSASSIGSVNAPAPSATIPFSSLSIASFVYSGGALAGDSSIAVVRMGQRWLDVTPFASGAGQSVVSTPPVTVTTISNSSTGSPSSPTTILFKPSATPIRPSPVLLG